MQKTALLTPPQSHVVFFCFITTSVGLTLQNTEVTGIQKAPLQKGRQNRRDKNTGAKRHLWRELGLS